LGKCSNRGKLRTFSKEAKLRPNSTGSWNINIRSVQFTTPIFRGLCLENGTGFDY
jgi:hypothetical protein